MDLELAGKVVVVTGAQQGHRLRVRRGVRARGRARRARLAQPARTSTPRWRGCRRRRRTRRWRSPPIWCSADERRAMVADVEAALGPIDVLVNSAGAAQALSARRARPAARGATRWTPSSSATSTRPTPCVKRMAARGRGAIVNIIGSGGKVANPVHLPGGSANAALMLATVGLAAAYGPKGVRVNGINPGGTLTGRVKEGLEAEARMTGLCAKRSCSSASRRAFRCAGSARRRKWRASRCSSPPTRRATSPARSCRWTAARAR